MVFTDADTTGRREMTWKCSNCDHKETVKKHRGESLSEVCPDCGLLGYRYPIRDTNM